MASSIKEKGAKAVLQLYHGGRLAVPHLIPNGETVSASSVAPLLDRGFYSIDVTPRSLSDEEVVQLIQDFGEATRRAIEAGFDGVEFMVQLGILFNSFSLLIPIHGQIVGEEALKKDLLFHLQL